MLSQIIKKYGLLCGALLLLHPACDNNKWAKGLLPAKATVKFNAVDTASESFNVFFNRFSTDSAFQISRIEFPLKLTIIGCEGERYTMKFIQKRVVISSSTKGHNNKALYGLAKQTPQKVCLGVFPYRACLSC
jgi:hypothetical protein